MVKFRPLVKLSFYQRNMPPSSRGLGRSPLKAKTGVRVPVGAHAQEDRSTDEVGRFLSMLRFESREKAEELATEGDKTT
jgi:hypothetical protein